MRRCSLWHLIQGIILVIASVLAIIYPVISSYAVFTLLGWLVTISGIARAL